MGPWRINSSLIIKDFFPLGVECQKSQPIGEKPCLFSCTVFADTLRKCKKPVGVSEKQSTGRCGMQVFRNAYDYFYNPHEMRQLPNQVPASITGIKNLLRKKKSTRLYAVQSPSGQGVPGGLAISGTPQPSSTKVEPSIIEHVLLLNTFQQFPHSLIKLNDFCVNGCTNWKVTNVL